MSGFDRVSPSEADGSDLRRLTYTAGNENFPSVSNDGKKIVFLRQEVNAGSDIWIAEADGSRQRLLLSRPSDAQSLLGRLRA
jgi:Tol biopolymer transport system component